MVIGSDGLDGYEVIELVGRGGFASVFRARDVVHKRDVAIKVLSGLLDDNERRSFDRERAAVGQLADHPNVVPVLESGYTPGGEAYLVLEFEPGGTLSDRLKTSGPIPWKEARQLVVAVGGAVQVAHNLGIRHRDIKPENILLSAYGVPKLADFGIASVSTGRTTTSAASLTLSHSPPEMLEGGRSTDAVDIYSLASTFHHLVSGSPPFSRADDEGVGPLIRRLLTEAPPELTGFGVPESVQAATRKAMSKTPSHRHPSVERFCADLSGERASPEPIEPRGTTATSASIAGKDQTIQLTSGLAIEPGALENEQLPRQLQTTISANDVAEASQTIAAPEPLIPLPQESEPPTRPIGKSPGGDHLGGSEERGDTRHRPEGRILVRPTRKAAAVMIVAAIVGTLAAWQTSRPDTGPQVTATSSAQTGADQEPQVTATSSAQTGADQETQVTATSSVETGADQAPQVTATIAVGDNPRMPVAAGDSIWVSNLGSGTVSRININTNEVTATITVGDEPAQAVAAEDSIWVPNLGSGTVSRINISTNEVTTITVGGRPAQAVAAEDSIWVSNLDSGTVSRINIDTNEVTATITVGDGAWGTVAAEDSIWVTNFGSGTVSRINIDTNEVTATITVGDEPARALATEDSIWVTNSGSGTVSRINITTNEVTTITVGDEPARALAVEDSIWVTNSGSGTLSRINITTNEVTATIPVGYGSPWLAAAVEDIIWISGLSSGTLSGIDINTNEVTATVVVGATPGSAAAVSDSIWVANLNSGTVSRIDS